MTKLYGYGPEAGTIDIVGDTAGHLIEVGPGVGPFDIPERPDNEIILSQLAAAVDGVPMFALKPNRAGTPVKGLSSFTLRDGTRRVARVSIPGGTVNRLRFYVSNPGTASATLIGRILKLDGTLIGTTSPVTITPGTAEGWVEAPLNIPALAGGDYFLSVSVSGGDILAWGSNLAPVRANLAANPSAEVNVSNYGVSSGAAATRSTADAAPGGGTACVEVDRPSPSAPAAFALGYCNNNSTAFPWKAGDTLYASCYLKLLLTAGTATITYFRMDIRFFNAAGAVLVQPSGEQMNNPPAGEWVRPTVSATAPPGTVRAGVSATFRLSASGGGATFRMDNLMISNVAQQPYGDGASPGWTWDGTPHLSTSRGPQGDVNLVKDPRPTSASVWDPDTAAAVPSSVVTWVPFPDNSGDYGMHITGTKDSTTDTGTWTIATDTPVANFAPPVVGGRDYTFSGDLYFDSLPDTVRILIIWYTRDIVSPSNVDQSFVPRRGLNHFVFTATAPPTAAYARLYAQARSNTPNDFVDMYGTRFVLVEGTQEGDFFDGDSPGCAWLGTPRLSPSIRWKVPALGGDFVLPAGASLPSTLAAQVRYA